MVDADVASAFELPSRFEDSQSAERPDVDRVDRLVERDSDVALSGEVVDLVGLDRQDQVGEARAVGQIAVMQEQAALRIVRVGV